MNVYKCWVITTPSIYNKTYKVYKKVCYEKVTKKTVKRVRK